MKFFICIIILCGWVPVLPQNDHQKHLISLEKARYYYDIESNFSQAEKQLLNLLEQNPNGPIRTRAHFLLGRIYDEHPNRGSSRIHYQNAMKGEGLGMQELSWLYQKMLKIDPNIINPMSKLPNAPGGLIKSFHTSGEDIKTLLLQSLSGSKFRLPVYLMEKDGSISPHPASVPSNEILLDATPGVCLAASRANKTIQVYQGPGKPGIQMPYLSELAWGRILLEGSNIEVLIVASDRLRLYRNGKVEFEYLFPSPTCVLSRSEQSPNSCFLRCPDNSLYHLDLRSQKVIQAEGTTKKPVTIHSGGELVVVQYPDHFELRNRVNFKKVLWTGPSQIQDRIYLYKNRLYLLKPNGVVQAYRTTTTQLLWQRDLSAEELYPNEDGMIIKTYAHQCISIDLTGRKAWSYNYGWDKDVHFLETGSSIIAHFEDGKRISLNRELLRAANHSEEFLFANFNIHWNNRNWKKALAEVEEILALEPGNGLAWSKKADCLSKLGINKQAQLESIIEASRSPYAARWSSSPPLKSLSRNLGARWVWKRDYGQPYFPILFPNQNRVAYLEHDNQTMVFLNSKDGSLIDSYLFPEELDLKVTLWKKDTLWISSPQRVFAVTVKDEPKIHNQLALKNPVCQAVRYGDNIIYSDWYGQLNSFNMQTGKKIWSRELGKNGLLLTKDSDNKIDVVDIEGQYRLVDADGKILSEVRLPAGIITEMYSDDQYVFVGYSSGLLVAMAKRTSSIAWSRNFSDQIFSLDGNNGGIIVLTTASRRIVSISASDGSIIARATAPISLFNRPTVTSNGYWLGTNSPALEKRNFNHEIKRSIYLPDLPGNPVISDESLLISTKSHFILSYPK